MTHSGAVESTALSGSGQLLEAVESGARSFARYSVYRDSGADWLGEVPLEWAIAPLYARYWLELGKMLDAKRITGEHLTPYLRNADVQWDYIDTSALPDMDIEPREEARFILRHGDLLVCEGGEVGRAAIWNDKLPRCAYQKALHRLRPRASRDLTRYLYYALLHAASTGVFVARGNPNTIPHLTGEQLRVYRFPFPSTDEQRAIVTFLDTETARIDELIAKKQRLIELLAEKRTALISHAVTKGLNPDAPMKDSGIAWLGPVPEHWCLRKLGYITTMQGGGTPSKDNLGYWNGSIPWVSPKDMKRRIIDDSADHVTDEAVSETTIRLIAPPAVLVVVRGMILSHSFPVGLTSVPVTINQDMKAISVRSGTSADFLAYLLQGIAPAFLALVEESGHGTKCLRTDLWKGFELFLPPFDEQGQICEHLQTATAKHDDLMGQVSRAIERLQEYRSALISAAVTGKIDVRDMEARM